MRNSYFSLCFCFLVFAGSYVTGKDVLRFECFQGPEIEARMKDIEQIVSKIYREPPYYFSGEAQEEEAYLSSYTKAKDAMVCLAFDQEKIIGIAAALPLSKAQENYRKPLVDRGYDVNTFFYLGEFGLQPAYIGSGLRSEMLDKMEKFARDTGKYQMLSFWEPLTERPIALGSIPQDDFWIKHGFAQHPEINFIEYWRNINDSQKTPHKAVYWIKKL